MWRSTGDIMDSWASIRDIAQSQLKVMEYNGHGCFNDMDMLVVGMNGQGNVGLTGCTYEEYRLHFIAGGFYHVLIRWIQNGCGETPAEMAEICCGALQPRVGN